MPTYEYECRSCSHVFEKYQSITARPLRRCPECGGPVRRLIGAGAAVIFKGSGFYETDYKRKSPPRPAGSKKPSDTADTAGGGKDDGKKEPAKKSADASTK